MLQARAAAAMPSHLGRLRWPGAPRGVGRTLTYAHSGKVTPAGLALALVAGLAAAVPLGFAYGILLGKLTEAPAILFPFAALLAGAGVGAAAALAGRAGALRNTPALLAAALPGAVLAVYLQWVAWAGSFGTGFAEAPTFPLWSLSDLRLMMELYALLGGFDVAGVPIEGGLLYATWVLEGVLIVGAALFAAATLHDARAYCESCGAWTRETLSQTRALGAPPQQVVQEADAGQAAALAGLPPAAAQGPHYRVVVESCPHCDKLTLLSVSRADPQGRRSKLTPLVHRRHVDRHDHDQLRGRGWQDARPAPAPA